MSTELDTRKSLIYLPTFVACKRFRQGSAARGLADIRQQKKLDFVDCVLYAYHKVWGDEIATFDKALKKMLEE